MLLYYVKYYRLKNALIAQKSHFINTLSHDFRVTLIAQLRGLELLQNNVSNEVLPLVRDINNSCMYSFDLVTTLIKIYKLECNKNSLNYEYVNLFDVKNSILDKISESAKYKNIKLEITTNCKNIYADRKNFTKAIEILVLTALQYSNKDSTIKFIINSFKNKFKIRIIYNGHPITEEEYKRMFSCNSSFSTVGHGIQMYFCRKIIELHNGKIIVNRYKNLLNSFDILLPKIA
jgi:K+-sensing histidine kinase KdpD